MRKSTRFENFLDAKQIHGYHCVGESMDTADAGKLGGAARAKTLSARRRTQIAKTANKARWDKYYLENPDRERPKRKRRAK